MAQFKKIGSKIFGVQLTAKEQEAMTKEINRQIAENYKQWLVNLDAMVLWTLHTYLGFGEKRLKQFLTQAQSLPRQENLQKELFLTAKLI